MRFKGLPLTLEPPAEGQLPTLAHMLHGVTTGIIGAALAQGRGTVIHNMLFAQLHHVAGLIGFAFPASDDEAVLATITHVLRERIREARDSKTSGDAYCPEDMFPVQVERPMGGEDETPADPKASAASERLASQLLRRIAGDKPAS